MQAYQRIYELLLDHCSSQAQISNLTIGLVWTLCQNSQHSSGLAMSPGIPTRTLPWSGSLTGKSVTDVAAWIRSWEPYQATVAMAAINSCINNRPLPDSVVLASPESPGNLAVFEHFLPQLSGKKVVVVGHYPGIERYQSQMQLSVLERQVQDGDLPDAASEYLLPDADWVFITASSIPNKTFPRLAELASNAKTVLIGPTLPWLPELHEFGIDYLAGVEITAPETLYHTVAQGGGVRIFNQGLHYRIAELTPQSSMTWIKRQIAACVAEKQALTREMEHWYSFGNQQRFPKYLLLEQVNTRLSRLDSSYKPLWDQNPETPNAVKDYAN